MTIKNDVTIGEITMKLIFDFESQRLVDNTLVMPQTMDGQDLAIWRRKYAKEISVAKQHPTIEYFYGLSSSKEKIGNIDNIRYMAVGLNTRSLDDLKDELVSALLKTDQKWSKEAIKKLRRMTLDELCTKYGYQVEKSVTPIIVQGWEED